MVLWKKESDDDGALYIDLLALDAPIYPYRYNPCLMITDQFGKNDDTSTEFRSRGDNSIKGNNWSFAMELYNQSLQFATEGSDNISFAYASRSACFFHLEKYEECLIDIELAMKANYPQRLMAELEQRKADCLKRMKERTAVKTMMKPVLNFPPDEKFPCMANILEVRSNDEFGKHIVAKSDIKVGEIVLVEEYYIFSATPYYNRSCKHCLKTEKNFIPCPNCSDVLFCDEKCKDSNIIHQTACGAPYVRLNLPDIKMCVESILIAISAFPEADDLMKFVENALATRDFDFLMGLPSEQVKYGEFLKLLALSKVLNGALTITYRSLMDIPKIKQYFDSVQKQRFLIHLIEHHCRITRTNSVHHFYDMMGIAIVLSLFNHSCFPNIMIEKIGNQIFGFAVRPVKKGEQLFISYRMGRINQMIESPDIRQTHLREIYQFECKCSRCMPCLKEEDRIRMQLDPKFQFLLKVFEIDIYEKKRSILKHKCISILSKYGQSPWCMEIEGFMIGFSSCIREEFTDINYN